MKDVLKKVVSMDNKQRIDRSFLFTPFKNDQRERSEKLFAKAHELATLIDEVTPISREQSLAFTHLEDVLSSAISAMVHNE